MFTVHAFLLLFVFSIGISDEYTCSDSATLLKTATQCSSVTWSVARLIDYNTTVDSDYYPSVLDLSIQELRVSVYNFLSFE